MRSVSKGCYSNHDFAGVQVVIVSLPEKKILVRIEEGGEVVARTDINGVDGCKLLGVYVHMTSGFIMPGVAYIEVVGIAPDGSQVSEKKMK